LKRRENAPLIAQMIMIALLIGSLPIAASPVVMQRETTSAFTLNVCQPLPSFSIGAASCGLPTPPKLSFELEAGHQDVIAEFLPAVSGREIAAPDPPPPKPLI